MKLASTKHERGTSLLEMLLFTPIALMFLFIAIDGGLAHLEKAAIKDTLRAAMNTDSLARVNGQIVNSKHSVLSFSALEDFDLTFSKDLPIILEEVATTVEETLTSARVLSLTNKQYAITTAAVILEFNETTGALTDYRAYSYQATRPNKTSAFELTRVVPSYPVVSMAAFIDKFLEADLKRERSRYSIPLGLVYNSSASGNPQSRFLNRSALLYGEISALTRGLNRDYARSTIGSYYAVQEQMLVPFRAILK